MSWATAIAQYQTNLRTAAAALSPAIPSALVRKGEPAELNADTIGFWLDGWRDSHTGGETFTRKNIERGIRTTIYLRGSVRAGAIDDALEDRLVAVEEALIAALMLDRDLAGNAIGLFIDEGAYGWEAIGDQLARTASWVAWIDLAETYSTSL
jgi:hypothetical protein